MTNSGAAAIGQYTENISYDGPRGNITGITRHGMLATQSNGVYTNVQAGQIDNLSMLYTPGTNRLQTVTDAGQTGFLHLGFNQLPGTGNLIHQYDASGNMTYDHSKRATIVHNHLNLPASVTFQNGNRIDYTYDASGKKLTTTRSTNGTTVEIQQYLGGIEYKQVGSAYRLEAIYHPEGRLYNTNITNTSLSTISLRNEYCIKDHLGNTRLTFADKNNNGQIDVTTSSSTNEILQENHYYPFGMSMEAPWMNDLTANDKPYQYNGKELESFGGLGWYDYGARYYDPTLSMWHGVDPLADKYPNISPYTYVANNPIRYIDPDGRWIYDQQKDGSYKIRTGVKNDGGANVHTYNERNGTVHTFNQKEKTFVTIKPGQVERMAAARVAEQKAVVSAIGNGIKKGGEIIGNIGDGISIGSTLLAVPTAGWTTPGIIAGEGIGLVGKILENVGNFIANGVNSETGIKFGTDLAFELLPAAASKGIRSLNVNTVAENIVKDAAVKAGQDTKLLMNSENLMIWRANLVTKAAEAGVKNKLEEKP
jgi:RHS repeat-associated protein